MTNFEQLSQEYREKGYVVLKRFFGPELVSKAREDVRRLFDPMVCADPLNLRYEARRTVDGGWVVDRIDPVIDLSKSMDSMARSLELGAILGVLMGGPVALLKSKFIAKRPGTNGYMAHQDFLYWTWLDIEPDAMCSVAVSLSDATEDSGGLILYPGLHHRLIEATAHDPDGDIPRDMLSEAASERPLLQRGDALVFHSLVPHESGANRSAVERNLLISSYAKSDDRHLYKRYYAREIHRRLESYHSGLGQESLTRFVQNQEEFDSSVHR